MTHRWLLKTGKDCGKVKIVPRSARNRVCAFSSKRIFTDT